MAKSYVNFPSGFRIVVLGDDVIIQTRQQTPRGTKYIGDQRRLTRKGKTKAEFTAAVEAAIFEMVPTYPK